MTDHLRWGILGTGVIAQIFTRDLTLAGFPVAAVGSRSIDKARSFASGGAHGVTFDVGRAHGSYQALLEDPHVDVVYVATPNPFHAEHAIAALRAGKHVLVEKPFVMSEHEARQVFEAAARSPR
ncbi:Gfo/Idh/MocA family protein [Dactylosporangium sp. CA-092794]|uniref:Gfo/Idh/MocA family protein n=1 Tax=Dactylosporangium sp. CA-092794 TaxID=3239929 RepID=UPI003D90126E